MMMITFGKMMFLLQSLLVWTSDVKGLSKVICLTCWWWQSTMMTCGQSDD